MKNPAFFLFCSLCMLICCQMAMGADSQKQSAADSSAPENLIIIPRPFQVKLHPGSFSINRETVLLMPMEAGSEEVQVYQHCLNLAVPFTIPVKQRADANYIQLSVDSIRVSGTEAYRLQVSPNHISITGHDGAGMFYGLQSLVQLAAASDKQVIPGCMIEDHPRFTYRGMHLDVSRHFFSVAMIQKWIDVLALYKINSFHWHLTDDQGWRIEIQKYPELQTVAAYRNETLIGHKKDTPHLFDGKRYGGYYTQEEVKQIVEYAAGRQITVIPEIEMPGHAMAALAAYPQLGCTGGPYQTATFWGIFSDVYCAGNDSTFTFLEDVLDEVLALFPSKYIHVGGDECPKQRWHDCPKCRKRMVDEQLKDENALQSYFISRIEKYLNSKGRQIIGWDEIIEGGLSPGATVMSWRGEEGGIEAARLQHDVVMTPEKMVYLDYYQSLNPDEPLAGGGYLPLSKIYSYEPFPPALTIEQTRYIIGVQANVWTEYMDSEEKAEYMMFPRMMALAEIGWSVKENKDYSDFLDRLRQQSVLFKKLNINAANTFDEITCSIGKNADGKTLVGLHSTLPQGIIHYTTDGSKPGNEAAVYQDMLIVEKNETIRAAVIRNDQPFGREFSKSFLFHQAVGKIVKLKDQPSDGYNPGEAALVNGVEAGNLYNDGQWLGFSGVNLEAVIDLGSVQNIKMIGMNILKYHWQKMWEPVELDFWISDDGVDYKKVYSQKDFPLNGINAIRAPVKNKKCRYIKIVAENRGTIPPGEYIAGAKALLMADEIIVY